MTPALSIPMGGFNLSGGVKVLAVLANAFAARGWRVWFIAPDFANTCPFPLDPVVAIQTIRCGPPWLPLPLRQLYYYAALMAVSARDADVCLANYYPTSLCAAASRLLMNRRAAVAYYVQGHEAMSHGLIAQANVVSRGIRYALARLTYALPVSFICVSRWVRDQIGRRDAIVAHAPVLDLAVFRPTPGARQAGPPVVIGTIGRQGATKDYGLFLAAMARLAGTVNIRVVIASPIAGEVPLPAGVPAQAVHATNEAMMAEFYNRCDVFVLTSRVEGFPLPPLEAMACGCAVVVTRCGGVTDWAEDEQNCLIVPVGDVDALTRAIRRVVEDDALRARLAAQGVATVRPFERDRILNHFVNHLESLAHRQPSAA